MTFIQIKSKDNSTTGKAYCPCSAFGPTFKAGKFFGFCVFACEHADGKCVARRSARWFALEFGVATLLVVIFIFTYDFASLFRRNEIPILLDNITDLVYVAYAIEIYAYNLWRHAQWLATFNELFAIAARCRFCAAAARAIRNVNFAMNATFVATLAAHCVFLIATAGDASVAYYLGKVCQTYVFSFVLFFNSVVGYVDAVFVCLSKHLVNALKYEVRAPMRAVYGVSSRRDFYFKVAYDVCKGAHDDAAERGAAAIERVRVLHERACAALRAANARFDPQLLLHVVVEIFMLVINWYAVVVGLAYDFAAPTSRRCFWNSLAHAATHSVALVVMLRNAQLVTNTATNFMNFLIEHATRVTDADELLQLRVFIEKLDQHQPITGNGVFTVDLSICAPILANVLTYVLVALQFEIPQNE